jgi:hypothetical protein
MSSPTKRGVTQKPKEGDQGLRRSARISIRQPGVHARRPESRQSKRSISSKDIKMPKIIKSASSTEEQKLDVLHNPNKDNPAVTKSHEDSHSDKRKPSPEASFWGSLDISSGIENLFEVMGLYNKSKQLIISMNPCSIKNMIQLSNLDLRAILEICFHVKIYEIL